MISTMNVSTTATHTTGGMTQAFTGPPIISSGSVQVSPLYSRTDFTKTHNQQAQLLLR